MFTVGIFSTHLPYIAFVLFYGFFFLFGIEKASAGELGDGQQIIPKVISVSAHTSPDVDENVSIYCNCSPYGAEFEQLLLYGRKMKHFCFCRSLLKIADYRFSWFSRPPPVA